MNRITRSSIAALAAVALALVATPAHATGGTPSGTIVDVAVAASGGGTPDSNPWDYDILVQAVLATGLAPTLADTSTKYTVFAPNDRAFLRLVHDLTGVTPASEAEALTTITTAFTGDQIKNILLYHVVAGKKLGPIRVLTAGSLTMANGGIVKPRGISLRDETPALRDPRLVLWKINIQASNGVIHTIDRVLVPAA
ncbi:fasciclin domain-containing protein [Microbacterium sp. NPDC019599]|uniref:fasciclin domain-containing protein n=1 Tax=Microbacterium sp. NPDC019599 TaxID=3154690 RepID=UPI0033E376AE